MASSLRGQAAVDWIKHFFAHDLDMSDPNRSEQVWTVFTILAQDRNVCAYFWAETFRDAQAGLDLERIQAVAQKFAEHVRRTGVVSPKANEYLTHLHHQANWADQIAGETASGANTAETIEQFLDDIREDDDQAN